MPLSKGNQRRKTLMLCVSDLAASPGPLLNLAARVKGLAAGGQVLADGASWVSVADYDRQYLQETDLGLNYLKGYDNPVRVYQISQKVAAVPSLPPSQSLFILH